MWEDSVKRRRENVELNAFRIAQSSPQAWSSAHRSFESGGEGGDGFGCLWVKSVAGVDAISYKSFTMLKEHGKRCYGDAASGRIERYEHSDWVSYSWYWPLSSVSERLRIVFEGDFLLRTSSYILVVGRSFKKSHNDVSFFRAASHISLFTRAVLALAIQSWRSFGSASLLNYAIPEYVGFLVAQGFTPDGYCNIGWLDLECYLVFLLSHGSYVSKLNV